MSTETARRWRRSEVSRQLLEAARGLHKAADKLTEAADALKAVEKATSLVAVAERQAQHPILGGVQKVHTGLPAPLRRRIVTQARNLESLAQAVRAWTITKDERVLAKRAKEKGVTVGKR